MPLQQLLPERRRLLPERRHKRGRRGPGWTPSPEEENAFAKMLTEGGVSANKVANKATWLSTLKRFGASYFVSQAQGGYEPAEAGSNSAGGSKDEVHWVRKDPSPKEVGLMLPWRLRLSTSSASSVMRLRSTRRTGARSLRVCRRPPEQRGRRSCRRTEQFWRLREATLCAPVSTGATGCPRGQCQGRRLCKALARKSVRVEGGNDNVYVDVSRNVERSAAVLGR